MILLVLFVSIINVQTTVTFDEVGRTIWAVPAGVSSITIVAKGGSGGNSSFGPIGGVGAIVTGENIPVISGSQLHVIVGGTGGHINWQ